MAEPPRESRPAGAEPEPAQPARTCPTCEGMTPAGDANYPFCSSRCRMADLGRWFSGEYVISRRIEERDIEETE